VRRGVVRLAQEACPVGDRGVSACAGGGL